MPYLESRLNHTCGELHSPTIFDNKPKTTMADPDTLIKSKIHYYAREKYYHSMQVAAVEGMKRFSGDPVFRFYYGVALVLEGRTQEGIRELDPLQSFPEVCFSFDSLDLKFTRLQMYRELDCFLPGYAWSFAGIDSCTQTMFDH